jgi:hypothetical protein
LVEPKWQQFEVGDGVVEFGDGGAGRGIT